MILLVEVIVSSPIALSTVENPVLLVVASVVLFSSASEGFIVVEEVGVSTSELSTIEDDISVVLLVVDCLDVVGVAVLVVLVVDVFVLLVDVVGDFLLVVVLLVCDVLLVVGEVLVVLVVGVLLSSFIVMLKGITCSDPSLNVTLTFGEYAPAFIVLVGFIAAFPNWSIVTHGYPSSIFYFPPE